MEIEMPKGTRDFSFGDKILRDEIINKLKYLFEVYGYSPLETPIFERLDVLNVKFGAGENSDAMKETFKLKDQGNRELALRFDLTVPFSRFVAMNPNLKMPFKRYAIGPIFRDGPIKFGRYRQFDQCDVDVVGVKSMIADAEMLKIAFNFFTQEKFDFVLKVNNRKLLEGVLLDFGVDKKYLSETIIIIDKLDKIGLTNMKSELKKLKLKDITIGNISKYLKLKDSPKKINSFLDKELKSDLAKEGWNELKEIYKFLTPQEGKRIIIDLSLARGFNYYTGTVFEGFLKDNKITSSICAGGRYDEMIGKFINNGREYPAVGISFGVDVICDAIMLNNKFNKKTNTQVYVIPIKTEKESFEIVSELRSKNINSDMDLTGKGITKNLEYANNLQIPLVVILGEKDKANKVITLKNMKTGKEEKIKKDNLIKELRSILSRI